MVGAMQLYDDVMRDESTLYKTLLRKLGPKRNAEDKYKFSSTAKLEQYWQALVWVSYCIGIVGTRNVVKKGFLDTGIHPLTFGLTLGRGRPSLTKSADGKATVKVVKENKQKLIEAFKRDNMLTEAVMDDCGLEDMFPPSKATNMRKDAMAHNRNRFIVCGCKYLDAHKLVKDQHVVDLATHKAAKKKAADEEKTKKREDAANHKELLQLRAYKEKIEEEKAAEKLNKAYKPVKVNKKATKDLLSAIGKGSKAPKSPLRLFL